MSERLDRVLRSLLIAITFAIVFVSGHLNTIDIKNLQAENKLLKQSLFATQQEVIALRSYIDERTNPATIQREQFNWIMREGNK